MDGGARRELVAFLVVFGAASLAVDLAFLAARWRLRAWDAGFTAGTRAARVLERVQGLAREEAIS